jgi:cell wall-associated NlpC family hydrolase
MRARLTFSASCLLAAFLPFGTGLAAQGKGLDFSYGRWWRNETVGEVYALTYYRPWFGSVDLGIGAMHLDDRASLEDRTQTGGQVSLAIGRRGGGLYAVGSGGVAMRHDGGSVDGVWSAGLGYALRPLSILTVAGELRYRVEKDDWAQGFWRFDEAADRKGWQLQAGLAFHFGGGRRTPSVPRPDPPTRESTGSSASRGTESPEFAPPSTSDIKDIARSSGASASTAEVAAEVIQTAIDVMGTPYQWGGTDENGFDCSGLIQYAYGESGVILPRVSRDQTRTGAFVEPRVPDLRPGDVLGFSVERSSRITHVGLYVGDGQFIHSSSNGVAISSLIATDPNSRWWQNRWVVARRIL